MVKKKREKTKPIDTQTIANQLADKFQVLLQEIIDHSKIELPWPDYLRAISKKLVVYTEKKHILDEGPFIKEERNLINTIARELALIIERKHSELAGQKLQMRRTMKAQLHRIPSAPFGIVGKSEPMRKVFESVEKAAAASATVVITGESGTGKELVARGIHYSSSRASAPFVPVNCGGIPENLLESELFGYVKGAFTGAFETRAGFFQTADGGTIFLDEISETSSAMQVKLLRVLQDKEICMVGSRRTQKVDVRILATTNKDILGLVKNGLFREDLYYRLNVINIDLPPLRDRGDDILLLIRYFAARFAKEAKKPGPRFSDNALDVLKNYNWPGNVRELENVIHRLVIMNEEDIIDVPDLPSLMRAPVNRGPGLNRTLAEVEAVHIRSVLAGVKGNKTQAAKILGIDRKTLREKLKCYSLDL